MRSNELDDGPGVSSLGFLGFGEAEKGGQQRGLVAHLTGEDTGGESSVGGGYGRARLHHRANKRVSESKSE